MITIFVGDVTSYLAEHALRSCPDATLLTSDNTKSQLKPGVYYASLGDFSSIESFFDVLDQAQHIVYKPPKNWSDQNSQGVSIMKICTEKYLIHFSTKKTVSGDDFVDSVDTSKVLSLADTRKSEGRQLWIVGGSDSNGKGIALSERYGQLIADKLNLPVSFLTENSSSLEWAADQILRSDIRSGDIIIWGTVPVSRLVFYHDNSIIHLHLDVYKLYPEVNKLVDISHLDNQHTLIYRSITNFSKVQNICDKLKIQLIIAGLGTSEYTSYLLKFKNYIHLDGRFERFLDLGDDGNHQGPAMHQWYANNIIDKLAELN